MFIHLKKDEAEYLLRTINLGEAFAQTHSWAISPKWRKLKFDKEKLTETLKEIAKVKEDDWKVRWDKLKEKYGDSNFEFCEYNLASFMKKVEKETNEL